MEKDKIQIKDAIKTPDGFAAVISMLLPRDHWIYKETGDPPAPLKTESVKIRLELESFFKDVLKYAIRASTNSGQDMDFDPDAMIQNFCVGLFGYYPLDFPREKIFIKKEIKEGEEIGFFMSKIKEK
jgi:hypothetical protein